MTTHKVYVNTESLSKEELKELQMEKLRELLNEFDPYIQKDGEHRDNLWYCVICGESAVYWQENGIQKIISKEYGFIKRLIENDKIDFDNFDYMINIKAPKRELYYTKAGFHTEALIMILSIQDNPIEFLCEILK